MLPVRDLIDSVRPLLRGARFWRGAPPVEGAEVFGPESAQRLKALVAALSAEHPWTARSIEKVKFGDTNPGTLGTYYWKKRWGRPALGMIVGEPGEIRVNPWVDYVPVEDTDLPEVTGDMIHTVGHEFGHAKRFMNPRNLLQAITRMRHRQYDPHLDPEEVGASAVADRIYAGWDDYPQPWLFPDNEIEKGFATGEHFSRENWLDELELRRNWKSIPELSTPALWKRDPRPQTLPHSGGWWNPKKPFKGKDWM